jgi:ASCH domain-containing protein
MKIITIRQPWASLIVAGLKDVENRTWPTNYRGPVLIQAAKRTDAISAAEVERRFDIRLDDIGPRGGVVGIVDIVDCVRPHPSKWYAPDHYAFVLANARALTFVPWKGALSLRNAPPELLTLNGLYSPQNEPAGVSDGVAA